MTPPAISVVIPTYNRARYVGAAIASVQAQTFGDFELIVVDDGSTDDTDALVAGLAREDPRVRYLSNPGRPGPGPARNAGIRQARGEWVAFLDSDDLWEPRFLDRLRSAVRPEVILAGANHLLVDRQSGLRTTMLDHFYNHIVSWWEKDPRARWVLDCPRLRSDPRQLTDPRQMLGMLIGGFLWIITSATMVRRSVLTEAGGFDTQRTRTEDLDLWLRLLFRGAFVLVEEVLVTCDITQRDSGSGPRYEDQAVDRRFDACGEARFHLDFLQRIPRRVDLTPVERAFHRERISSLHRICGHAAGPGRPVRFIRHHAAALMRSAEQRRLFRHDGRAYFRNPW